MHSESYKWFLLKIAKLEPSESQKLIKTGQFGSNRLFDPNQFLFLSYLQFKRFFQLPLSTLMYLLMVIGAVAPTPPLFLLRFPSERLLTSENLTSLSLFSEFVCETRRHFLPSRPPLLPPPFASFESLTVMMIISLSSAGSRKLW